MNIDEYEFSSNEMWDYELEYEELIKSIKYKTQHWSVPFIQDELIEYTQEELTDLLKFVLRQHYPTSEEKTDRIKWLCGLKTLYLRKLRERTFNILEDRKEIVEEKIMDYLNKLLTLQEEVIKMIEGMIKVGVNEQIQLIGPDKEIKELMEMFKYPLECGENIWL